MNGTGGEVATLGAGELLGQRVLPGTSDCTARSEVVLYRIDDWTLEELLAGHPELAAGLAAIAAARRGALDGGSDARRAAEPAAGLVPRIQRLFRS